MGKKLSKRNLRHKNHRNPKTKQKKNPTIIIGSSTR
jgi:hypothetical protein